LNPQLRFHSLRHNFASWLVSSGVDLYVVGKLLCHKDVKTSTRYAHLADSALRQAASKMDLFVTKPGNVVQLKGKNDG
jgi:site-specific recombinase XerD